MTQPRTGPSLRSGERYPRPECLKTALLQNQELAWSLRPKRPSDLLRRNKRPLTSSPRWEPGAFLRVCPKKVSAYSPCRSVVSGENPENAKGDPVAAPQPVDAQPASAAGAL